MFDKGIIAKLKQKGLTGRGGAGFPTWQKWEAVKNIQADKRYIVCNASEGEPFILKDKYILENYPEEVIYGLKIALKAIPKSEAIIYLNEFYYQQFKNKLEKLIAASPITLFSKPGGYLKGEETTLLNIIEGEKAEPRVKPPYPTEKGLWGKPTLINNVETFYWISKIAKNEYQGHRFYSIEGEVKNRGVFELPETYTIKQILEQTGNYPNFSFFLQVGGGASGAIMTPNELDQPIKGAGAILVFNKQNTDPLQLMAGWAEFFIRENCDQCTPCREGVYRLKEALAKGEIKKEAIDEVLLALEKTSFCPLGKSISTPFKTALQKLF
ncbi:MAG: NADH-ubiquinone oxidoreductase-F iron-sulfur binding region domain-containing protein [Candidatus Pacebacteria bacterium]|nr:NADH-ubiquinone oxidoreductase-F iron-sulfur binding region domain-containing protein [Candidatus Paceibacterota bacterium]